MIRRAFQSFLLLLVVMAVILACSRKEGARTGETETIAPAAAQTSPNDTDAMTQTVELVDGRSEADGGVLTSPNPPVKTPGTTTISPAATATAEKRTGSTKSRPPGSTQ